MSYTGIVSEEERDRRFENRLNVVMRHCKIGKVTRKYLPTHLRLDDAPMAPSWPAIRQTDFEKMVIGSPYRAFPPLTTGDPPPHRGIYTT
jgi:hypothetical protein